VTFRQKDIGKKARFKMLMKNDIRVPWKTTRTQVLENAISACPTLSRCSYILALGFTGAP